MKKIYEIVFSPTGRSQKVAGYIAEEFKGKKTFIDLCKASADLINIDDGSLCIFSVPCYGGRVPVTAEERLANIHGDDTPAILCVTYGNRAFEDSLLELSELAEKNGFKIIGAAAVSTEHNIMHVFGKGRPDEQDKIQIKEFAASVAEKLKNHINKKPDIPGNRPYKERHSSSIDILVDENTCVCCGMSALKCPVGAISKDGKKVDKDKCIGCMRCIEICRSRSIPKEYVDALIDKLGEACKGRKENSFFL